MNRCDKTGLTDKDWRTILDVINVFDPNDIAHVYPEMGSPEFTQDVTHAFKAVLAHVERNNIQKSHGGTPLTTGSWSKTEPEPVDTLSLAYQQWLHGS